MTVNVNKNTSKDEFEKKLKSLQPKKGKPNLREYQDIFLKGIDGLKYQKENRSEWE